MGKRILVVDDDVELCSLLTQCLGNEGFKVSCLHSGKHVLPFLHEEHVDLVILDVMLPETDGFAVLRQIRESSDLPVLMLSAKSEEMSKVLGLKTGADDYLTKPFGLSELVARVESLFRRCRTSGRGDNGATLVFGGLRIDEDACTVSLHDEAVQLTPKEYKLLCFLAENPGKVFTKKQIYHRVWNEDFLYDDNTIMALISRLRKKVESDPDAPAFIQTVRGIGYRFSSEAK